MVALAALHYFPFLAQVSIRILLALPAFLLGVLGHKLLLRAAEMIGEFRKGGA